MGWIQAQPSRIVASQQVVGACQQQGKHDEIAHSSSRAAASGIHECRSGLRGRGDAEWRLKLRLLADLLLGGRGLLVRLEVWDALQIRCANERGGGNAALCFDAPCGGASQEALFGAT